jgi:WD40 repeat protein
MKHRMCLMLLFLVFAACPAPAGESVRKDTLGDPLPQRALVRLGTARWKTAEYVTDLAFSPDDAYLFSSGVRVQKWEVKSGHLVATYPGHFGEMIALSPDGKWMLVGGDRPLRVVDVATGKITRTFLKEPCDRAVFASNGRTVLCILQNGKTLALYGFALAQERRRYEGAVGRVRQAVFSPDGKLVAAVSVEGNDLDDGDAHICIWETETSKLRTRMVSKKQGLTYNLAFVSDNRRLLIGARQGILGFDTENGQPIAMAGLGARGHLVVDRTGRFAVVGFEGILWDLPRGQKLGQLTPPRKQIGARAISHDSKTIATAPSTIFQETIDLWDAATGQLKTPADRHRAELDEVAFAPDGKTLATRSAVDGTVQLWDRATGNLKRSFQWGEAPLFAYGRMSFPQHGQIVQAAGHRWDIKTGKRLPDLVGMTDAREPEGKVGLERRRSQFLQVSRDGRYAADLDMSLKVRVWDLAGNRVLFRIEPLSLPQVAPGSSCSFTADSQAIVVVQDDAVAHRRQDPIRVIEIATQKMRATYGKDASGILAFACTPDDEHLILLTQTGLEVRSLSTGQIVLRPSVRPRSAALGISPNGRLLAFESEEGEIALLEIATGAVVDAWRSSGSVVHTLALSPDGRHLLTGHRDSTALLWDLDPDLARDVLLRSDAQLWDGLAAKPAEAHAVVSGLVKSPGRAVKVLEKRMMSETEPDEKQIRAWINDLEQTFTRRDEAAKQIRKHGLLTAPYLRDALKDRLPLEMRRRLSDLLKAVETGVPSSNHLRYERAVQVLEMVDTADARRLLSELAKGPAGSRRTRVRAALERFNGSTVR